MAATVGRLAVVSAVTEQRPCCRMFGATLLKLSMQAVEGEASVKEAVQVDDGAPRLCTAVPRALGKVHAHGRRQRAAARRHLLYLCNNLRLGRPAVFYALLYGILLENSMVPVLPGSVLSWYGTLQSFYF